MTEKSIFPWQQPQWQQLLSQFRQGRLPHALILSGAAGLGKLIFAEQFAQYLLCKEAGSAAQACQQCSGCRLILAHNHPDLLYLVPEESGKNIKIDQIREMMAALNQTAQRAGYQVAIIAPAEALNKAAANALLKTLEEPAGKVVLMLVSHQSGTLPATIVSRCQHLQFTGRAGADTWLATQLQALHKPVDAELLLKIAEYAPMRALDLAQHDYLNLRDQLLTHLQAISRGQGPLLTAVADYLKQNLLLWVDAFIALAGDMLRLQLGVQTQWLINQDRITQLQQLTLVYPISRLLPLLTKLGQARQSLLNIQVHLNEQLLLESILIQADINFL